MRETRTSGSVGAPGGQPPGATRLRISGTPGPRPGPTPVRAQHATGFVGQAHQIRWEGVSRRERERSSKPALALSSTRALPS